MSIYILERKGFGMAIFEEKSRARALVCDKGTASLEP